METTPALAKTDDVPGVRVCYLHGRPGPHPLHGRFARAVGGDFHFVDFRLRWQDRERSVAYRIVSWLVCAATLPGRRDYDVFLVDNLHFPPVLMKLLFLRRRQKIVVHLGSHTLYFLRTHRFGRWVERLHLWALARYDALLCEGRMAEELARSVLPERCPPTYVTFLGPPKERAEALRRITPDPGSRRLLLVAHGPGRFRMHYKGLDLMVEAFALAAGADPTLAFDIVGEWDEEVVRDVSAGVPESIASRIRWHGRLPGIEDVLAGAALYLHCSRGDAFPTATMEAMTAGLVPIVSEWTGTKEVVERVDPDLVCPLDAEEVAARIAWFFALPAGERAALSGRAREAASGYTEETATEHYRATFARLCADLGVGGARGA